MKKMLPTNKMTCTKIDILNGKDDFLFKKKMIFIKKIFLTKIMF